MKNKKGVIIEGRLISKTPTNLKSQIKPETGEASIQSSKYKESKRSLSMKTITLEWSKQGDSPLEA